LSAAVAEWMLPAPPRPDDFYSAPSATIPLPTAGATNQQVASAGVIVRMRRQILFEVHSSHAGGRESGEREAVDLSLPSVTTDARGGTSFVLPLSLPSLSSDMLDDVDSNSTHLAAIVEPAHGDRGQRTWKWWKKTIGKQTPTYTSCI
jgi:hypothetical protein